MKASAPRFLKRLLLWFMGALIVIGTLMGVLAGTPFGSLLIVRGAERVLAPHLQIAAVRGTLLGGLDITGLTYQEADLGIHAGTLSLRWRPLDLLGGRLSITALEGTHIAVVLPETTPATSPQASPATAPPPFQAPMSVLIDRLALHDVFIAYGSQGYFIADLHGRASLDRQTLRVTRLTASNTEISLRASGRLALATPFATQLDGSYTLRVPRLGRTQGRASLNGPLNALDTHIVQRRPFHADLQGRLDLLADTPSGDFELDWKDAAAPQLIPKLVSPAGSLHLVGTPDDYRLTGHAQLRGFKPALDVTDLTARGSLDHLAIQTASLHTLDGHIDLTGRLAWGNALEWQAKVTGRDLDPAALVSELTGRVGFELQANGTAQQASVNLNALNGTLRQQPLRGKARAQWSSDALRFDQLEIKLGASTLDARGRLSRDSDLLFALGIPNLAQLWPTAAGRIQINGRFTGTPTRPALRLDATGRALRLGAATLESATLRSRALGQGRNRVTLSARNLHAPSTDLSRLRLTLTAGLQGAVEASFSARSTHGSARLAIDGQWQGGRLKGRIAQFEVSPTGGAAWRLPAPSALTATTQAIQLAPTCLTDTGDSRQHLCIEGTVSRQGPSPLDIDGHGIPLAVLNPGLPQGYLLAGRLDLKAHLTGTWQTPDATARLTTRGASLHTPRQQPAQTLAFALEPLTLQLQNRTLSVGLQATLPASGRLDGTLQVNGFNTPRASLQGNLRGELPDLGFLQSFPLPVEIRSGSASLDIKTAGAADKPRLSGQARVDRLAFVLPLAGIDVTDGSLDLTRSTTTSPWRTKGSAHSGKGTLEWRGTVEGLDVARPRAQLTLSGHDFEALNLTGIEASVSPDMTVDLNPDLLKLRGRLTLDRLDVHVRRPPPEAISISPDTEVVGRQTEKRSRGPAVDAQLALDLGQNAHVSAYGLVGQIAGALELKQQGAQPPTAEGVVTLDKARYQGYGLDLPITSGRLLFAGPVDNPGLDITAERKTADVTARLHLTGTLREPVSQVSSEPALPQEEALSYLLTGHGLSDASRSDAALLVRAVASLHMDSEGGGLMNRLEQRTGLDEISVQGGESFDQTSLLLGKYLSPKLYLSYTQGMLKRMSSIGLRYQLTPQVQVQIDSGEAQAADVLYRLRY